MKNKNKDRPIKSIAKAVSWRITATLITMSLIFAFTGKINLALSIGILETALKIFVFYVHERSWNRISWGTYK